jgi:hypothetical protein
VELEARTVIASRYDQSPSGTDVLDEPVVVVRAVGTTVVPKAHSRGLRVGRPAGPPDPGDPGGSDSPAGPIRPGGRDVGVPGRRPSGAG